jgi:hypothetical protein
MTHTEDDAPRFRLHSGQLLGVALLAGMAVYLAFYPLWHTDVWAHAKYGEWYCKHRGAPEVEPLSPFSDKDVPFANVAWLSQVTYHLLFEFGAAVAGGDAESQLRGGAEVLRSFHLVLLIARFAILWLALKRFGGSCSWATVGVFLYIFAVGLGSAVQRPQAFGLTFFTVIIYALSAPTLSRRAMVLLPLMFLVWANMHGTFIAGLGVLGLHTIGRVIERGLFDRDVWRLVIVGVLSGLATLINPHGPFLYHHLLAFGAHPNLKSMTEWFPMRLTAQGGAHWPYVMSLVLLAFVRILGGRKVGAAGWLVALPFAIWPWFQARAMFWWWTVAVWLLARLGPGLADRFPTMPSLPEGESTRGKAWAACGMIVAAVLLFPPIRSLAPGVSHDLDHTVAPGTPWRLALELNAGLVDEGRWFPELRKALREHYPGGRYQGTIFASETQGDFLIWAMSQETPVLMFTHAHVFPFEFWELCRDVKAANPGWREFLARKGANLIVVETDSHEELTAELRHNPDWLIVHDGPASPVKAGSPVIVALRKTPIPTRDDR